MTVREIAKLANVSIGTVDRVLHNRGKVSPEAAEKISAIIKEHQFTPNPIARRLKRSKAYLFCALIPRWDQDSEYWEQTITGIQKGANEIASMGIKTEIIEYNHFNVEEFKKATQKTLNKEPDGIIFAPIYPPETSKPFIEKLQKRNIPYTFFDSDLPGTNPICAIGQDSYKSGYLAAKLLHLFTGKTTGPVAVFYAPMSYHISRRKDGFLRYTKEQDIKTVIKQYTRNDGSGSLISEKETAAFMRKHQDLQGIFVSYSDARQVAEAAKDMREERNIFIIGFDLVPANYRLLKKGRIDAIIAQRPQEQSYQALLSLYRHVVLENAIIHNIEMPIDIYLKENLPKEIDIAAGVSKIGPG